MRRPTRRRTTALAVVLVSAFAASPALASNDEPGIAQEVTSAVAEAAPEVFEDKAKVDLAEVATTGAEVSVADIDISLPASSGETVTLDSATGSSIGLTLPGADDAQGSVVAEGVVAYETHNDATTAVVVKDDGSVQVATVIDGPDAPTRYSYEMTVPSGGSLQDVDGTVVLRSADGTFAGALAPAWAKDVNGQAVATRYEIDGLRVTQIVEHSADTAYPVVADPWLGVNLFRSVTVGYERGLFKISAGLSTWGYGLHQGSLGLGPQAHLASKSIFFGAGWNEVKARQPIVVAGFASATIKQQYDCHVIGGYYPFAGKTWDLEAWRSNFPDWYRDVRHTCNWIR